MRFRLRWLGENDKELELVSTSVFKTTFGPDDFADEEMCDVIEAAVIAIEIETDVKLDQGGEGRGDDEIYDIDLADYHEDDVDEDARDFPQRVMQRLEAALINYKL